MKIRLYFLLFLFGWVHNQAYGSCSTKNMNQSNVIQFCSGSNITNSTIILNAVASNRITNCICRFTVLEKTFVNLTGICPTKIQYWFLHNSAAVQNACGDILQHVTTNQTLQFLYSNDDNSKNSYCNVLQTNVGELKGTCFPESFIPSTEQHSTNGHEVTTAAVKTTKESLQLVIIIIVSVLAIVSTLVIIIVAFSLRKRRLKKQTQSRPQTFSANPSFDQADDSGDEMKYNELYHSRIINRGQIEVKCNSVGEDKNVQSYRNNLNNISASALSKANDSDFQRQNGKSSVNLASMKNKNSSDDSGDEMVYNELYHSRNTNGGHMMPAYSDYEDVASNPNDSDFQSRNDNFLIYSTSTKHKNSNEDMVNSEHGYAVPDKKKKQ